MKNIGVYGFFLVATLLLSCTPDMYEVWINKNGRTKIEVTFDADGSTELLSFGGENNSSYVDIDTTLSLYDQLADSLKVKMTNPSILRNVVFKTEILEDQKKTFHKISIDLKDDSLLDSIVYSVDELLTITRREGESSLSISETEVFKNNELIIIPSVDLDNGVVRIPALIKDKDGYFLNSLDSIENLIKQPEPDLMNELIYYQINAEYGDKSTPIKTVVHVPKKILFSNRSDAIIDGNTISFAETVLDVIKKGQKDKIIKFEK